MALHAVIVIVVPLFAALCWWQVGRAVSGNTLSWAYAVEWPFFAGYAVYMWWKLVHDPGALAARPSGTAGAPLVGQRAERRTPQHADAADATHANPTHADPTHADATDTDATDTDAADADMAAYNRYLAALDASGRRKHW